MQWPTSDQLRFESRLNAALAFGLSAFIVPSGAVRAAPPGPIQQLTERCCRTLSLPHRGRLVIEANLNCSPSRHTCSGGPYFGLLNL